MATNSLESKNSSSTSNSESEPLLKKSISTPIGLELEEGNGNEQPTSCLDYRAWIMKILKELGRKICTVTAKFFRDIAVYISSRAIMGMNSINGAVNI